MCINGRSRPAATPGEKRARQEAELRELAEAGPARKHIKVLLLDPVENRQAAA